MHAVDPGDDMKLQQLLQRASPLMGQGAAGSMTVERQLASLRLVLHVSPVGGRLTDFGMRRVAALVLVVDPARAPHRCRRRGFGAGPDAHGECRRGDVGQRAQPPRDRRGHGPERKHGPLAREADLRQAGRLAAGRRGATGAIGLGRWNDAGLTSLQGPRVNVDIGNQFAGGAQAVVLGSVANSRGCEQSPRWERKSFQHRPVPEPITSASNGQLWLLLGFEDRTAIYFTRACVPFTRM